MEIQQCMNDLLNQVELNVLREFKQDAEDTCGSSVVMQDLMDRVYDAETKVEEWKKKSIYYRDVIDALGYDGCEHCQDWKEQDETEDCIDKNGRIITMCFGCRDDLEYFVCDECYEWSHPTLNRYKGQGRDICGFCFQDKYE